jgi:hypothetical protein
MPATGLVHTLVDRLAGRFAEGAYHERITAAREEYCNLAGKFFEDDGELYEQRSAAFLEWYVCERPLGETEPPPALAVLLEGERAGALPRLERLALAALASSHRSVFEVKGVSDGAVELRDLIGGGQFVVRERRSTLGFHPGDVLEARLCWSGRDLVFGKTFLFHPTDAREAIADLVAEAGKRGEDRVATVFQLARLYLRWHRQGHVAAARIYREVARS